MRTLVLIFTIYISGTLSKAAVQEKNHTVKYKPYVNGKILIKAPKYEKTSVKNTPASESYTAFQVVGVPKTIENVPDSPYFPNDRTDDPQSRKELSDYPWSLLRQKRSAELDVSPVDEKKVESEATEVKKVTETTLMPTTLTTPTTPTTSTSTTKVSSSTEKDKTESTTITKTSTTTATTDKKNTRLNNNKAVTKVPKKDGKVRKRTKVRPLKGKKTLAGRAKPKGKQAKTANRVRAKNATTRIKKAAKKKGKARKGTAPKKSKKKTNNKTKKGQDSKTIKRRSRKNPKETRRLIAAREALIEDYPYVVSIQKNREHWCSGALLNPRLVITTANCLWKATHMSRMEVRAGSRHTSYGGQKVGIQEVIKHPRWGLRKNPDNDVALLLLDKNIKFSDSVHGVDLPNKAMMPPFDDAWITSWGSERRDGIYDPKYSSTLQVYHSRLINMDKCNNITMRFSVIVTDNFICLAQSGRQAPCTRDTGAPAVSDGVLWGLASWGLRKLCGTERFPAIFSYIASPSNLNFITNATRYLMSDKRQYPFSDRYPNIQRK